jgi:hypothetical protein
VNNLAQTIIANIASGLSSSKQSPLLAENGAIFHGSITPLPDNQFRASCWATLDDGQSYRSEEKITHTLQDNEDAAS